MDAREVDACVGDGSMSMSTWHVDKEDKDKDKDAFTGPKEFFSPMIMT